VAGNSYQLSINNKQLSKIKHQLTINNDQ